MVPRTRPPSPGRARRRDEIRDRLLELVKTLIADGKSYTELSVQTLASGAGLSRSTFYVHFEDKGDLLGAWLEEIQEQVTRAAAPWWELDTTPARADVRSALTRRVGTYRPHVTLMAAVYDAASYDSFVREKVDAIMEANISALTAHIRKGQARGTIDPKLLPHETASWLIWMAERVQHQLLRSAPEEEVEPLIDTYTDIVWDTLYAPVATRQSG